MIIFFISHIYGQDSLHFLLRVFLAAMGGLLGLGLGMSFISVIEVFYYLFFRRFFLWHRSNWSHQKFVFQSQTMKIAPSTLYVAELKKNVSIRHVKSFPLLDLPSIQTISSFKFDEHERVVRRGSLNLPSHLQARLSKY